MPYQVGQTISAEEMQQLMGGESQQQERQAVSTQRPGRKPLFSERAVGAGKGIIHSVVGTSSMGERLLRGATKALLPKQMEGTFGLDVPVGAPTGAEKMVPEKLRTPQTQGEEGGFQSEQFAEYFVPVFGGGKTLLQKALLSAADVGLKSSIQAGSTEEAIAPAGLAGGISAGMSALGSVGKLIGPSVGRAAASIVGTMIGKRPEYIIGAFKNPEKIRSLINIGTTPAEVRIKAIEATRHYMDGVAQAFENGLEVLQGMVPRVTSATGQALGAITKSKNMVGEVLRDATKGIPATFRKFRVSVTGGGENLDFDKLNSAIVSPSERKNLAEIWKTIREQTDFTPKGMQDVAARLNALSEFTDGARTQSSALAVSMLGVYKSAIKNSYPALARLRDTYAVAQKIFSGLDDLLRPSKTMGEDPTSVTAAIKKLSNIYNEDNDAYLTVISNLEKETGEDFMSALIASEFRNVLPSSFGSRFGQLSFLAGGAFVNPLALLVLPLFSPKIVGRLVTGLGGATKFIERTAEKTQEILPRAAGAVQSLITSNENK